MRAALLRISKVLRQTWRVRAKRAWGDARSPRLFLTPQEFQTELVVLGLSGREFSPKDYVEALERHQGIKIVVCVFPDVLYPDLTRTLARSGRVAEVVYSEEERSAVILVPGTLAATAQALAVYHELGHLAAGDLPTPRKLALEPPLPHDPRCNPSSNRCDAGCPREEEAELRAYYALVAGSLGPSSPHVERMYDAL